MCRSTKSTEVVDGGAADEDDGCLRAAVRPRDDMRKEKALAETAALLVLQKKFNAYLEGEDIDTILGSDD